MSSQPVSFAGNIVLSQLWPPIYVNILHFTCLSVVAWWVPMQGATWEMQMLKIGLFLSLTPSRPLGPSLLFLWGRVHVFALGRSGMGFLLPFSVALLPSMPLSPQGWELGSEWSTGQWWTRPRITSSEIIAYPVRKGTAPPRQDLWLFHKCMWHACFYAHFLSFSFNITSLFCATETRNNKCSNEDYILLASTTITYFFSLRNKCFNLF